MIQNIISNAKLMDVEVSINQAERLISYVKLIQKWNKIYNLTAIKDFDNIINTHIFDSLSIVNYIKPTNLLDIGSGAGLPSIVLAIMLPKLQVLAVDSVAKKCNFMQFVKTSLSLNNFQVKNQRIEGIQHNCFEQITSRAFATIDNNIKLSKHLLCPNGVFLLMKGNDWQQENTSFKVKDIILKTPFISGNRFLLKIMI